MTVNSKTAIPYGNSFGFTDPWPDSTYGQFFYNFNPTNSGQAVYLNRAIAPIDAINNPTGNGNIADLLQGSSDPTKLTSYSGTSISYNMQYPLVAGNTYTISVWCMSAFTNNVSGVRISIKGSGNWGTGYQSQSGMGNFSDPSWGFLNGSVNIVQSAISITFGAYTNAQVMYNSLNLSIPETIPTADILFTRYADHIRSVSNNGSNSVKVFDPVNNSGTYNIATGTLALASDLSVLGSLNSLLSQQVGSTFVYQQITPSVLPTPTPVNNTGNSNITMSGYYVEMDAYIRVAQETISVVNNKPLITINSTVTGNITGYGFLCYFVGDSRPYIFVYQNYDALNTSWRDQKWGITLPSTVIPKNSSSSSAFLTPFTSWTTTPAVIDTTQPYGFGFFFKGDLAVYGGIRVQLNTTYPLSTNTSGNALIDNQSWTRVSFTFQADTTMQNTFVFNDAPGFIPPYNYNSGYSTITISNNQPNPETVTSTGHGYKGNVKLSNGNIFCVPYEATQGIIYNPSNDSIFISSCTFPGNQYFCGGILTPDNRILLIPYKANSLWVYNPALDTLTNYTTKVGTTTTNGVYTTYGSAFTLSYGNVVLFPTANGGPILEFNPSTNNIDTIGTSTYGFGFGVVYLGLDSNGRDIAVGTSSSTSYVPQLITITKTAHVSGGNTTYTGSTVVSAMSVSGTNSYIADNFPSSYLLPNGNIIYLAGSSNAFIVYNPTTGAINNTFITALPTGKSPLSFYETGVLYSDLVILPNGDVFFVPCEATSTGIYNYISNTFRLSSVVFTGQDSYSAGMLMNNGMIFLTPFFSNTASIYNPTNDTLITASGTYQAGYTISSIPYSPYYASMYLFGLYINDGSAALPYVPDSPLPVVIWGTNGGVTTAPSTFKSYLPTITRPPNSGLVIQGSLPEVKFPTHHLGLNITGNSYYGTERNWLNLIKLTNMGRYRAGLDPDIPNAAGWQPFNPRPQSGYYMCMPPANGNWSNPYSFNTKGSALTLTGVMYNAGDNFFIFPVASNGNWPNVNKGWPDLSLSGPGVPSGCTVVPYSSSSSTIGCLYTGTEAFNGVQYETGYAMFYVSIPFTTNFIDTYQSSIFTTNPNVFTIKRFTYDNISYLELNENGYPTVIPPGIIPSGLVYRVTPFSGNLAGAGNVGSFPSPFMPSGNYVLKWDGTGTATLLSAANTLITSPGPYPATLVSSSSNRAVFNVDCSGNTSTGQACDFNWYGLYDTNYLLAENSQCGFMVSITSTSSTDPLVNLVLVEEQYEALLDSGEIFYPEFIDRLADFRTLRFLDWDQTNNFYAYVYDITQIANVDDVSWCSSTNHVPWEIMIALCNKTMKNCWINLHPAMNEEMLIYVAKLFLDNLDPRLMLYVEYGNEPWNGGMTGYYFQRYGVVYNVQFPGTSPNPSWNQSEMAYAMLSAQAFNIVESVFAGYNGLLQPAKLNLDPKQQLRRLVRVCSINDGGWSNAHDLFSYASLYTTNPYKVPYDAVCSNCYNNEMAGGTFSAYNASTAPNPYPFTMTQTLQLTWLGLSEQTTNCTYMHHGCMTDSLPLGSGSYQAPGTLFGYDTDGDPITPAYCIYEGGYGSPGAVSYMLYNIILLKFEMYSATVPDTAMNVWNYNQQMFNWWNNEVNIETNAKNQAIMNYNLYESVKLPSNADQWGLAFKAYYPKYQYNTMPTQRAIAASAGELLPTISAGPAPTWTPQSSKPQLKINGSFVYMINVWQMQSGVLVLKPANIIKYYWNGVPY